MNVVVTTEHHFFRTPDGAVWTHGAHAYPFWTRYHSEFDGVSVLARLRDAAEPESDWRLASGPGVRYCAVPDYRGPWQYLAQSFSVRRAIGRAVSPRDAVILRVSSHIANCLETFLWRRGHPYGVEVVNDPFDVFSAGAVDYRLRPLFRWRFTGQLRHQCQRAIAAAYVTESTLQARYPCPRFAAAVSDVEIPAEALVSGPRTDFDPTCRRPFQLILVGSLAQRYKAPDVLIRATAECIRMGLHLTLRIVGEGRYRPEMERLAATLGLAGCVHFLGQLPSGARVREQLDASDLFVLPSHCEGLPRALVEAMARSLPCLATNVGGIPELLSKEDLFRPGDTDALVRKLMEVVSDPVRLAAMAARNLRRARDFREDLLSGRRAAFLHEIRRATSAVRATSTDWRPMSGETAGC